MDDDSTERHNRLGLMYINTIKGIMSKGGYENLLNEVSSSRSSHERMRWRFDIDEGEVCEVDSGVKIHQRIEHLVADTDSTSLRREAHPFNSHETADGESHHDAWVMINERTESISAHRGRVARFREGRTVLSRSSIRWRGTDTVFIESVYGSTQRESDHTTESCGTFEEPFETIESGAGDDVRSCMVDVDASEGITTVTRRDASGSSERLSSLCHQTQSSPLSNITDHAGVMQERDDECEPTDILSPFIFSTDEVFQDEDDKQGPSHHERCSLSGLSETHRW